MNAEWLRRPQIITKFIDPFGGSARAEDSNASFLRRRRFMTRAKKRL